MKSRGLKEKKFELLHLRSTLKDVTQTKGLLANNSNSIEVPSQTSTMKANSHCTHSLRKQCKPRSSSTTSVAPPLPSSDKLSESLLTTEYITDPDNSSEHEAVIPACDPENTPPPNPAPELQSKLCKAIGKVIGQ